MAHLLQARFLSGTDFRTFQLAVFQMGRQSFILQTPLLKREGLSTSCSARPFREGRFALRQGTGVDFRRRVSTLLNTLSLSLYATINPFKVQLSFSGSRRQSPTTAGVLCPT
jgi:hypothetical protein